MGSGRWGEAQARGQGKATTAEGPRGAGKKRKRGEVHICCTNIIWFAVAWL